MSFVGSGIVGQRLDQPKQFQYVRSSPESKNFSIFDNNDNNQTEEQENLFPRPLDFDKKGEKIDYFHALKELGTGTYQEPQPQQIAKPLKQQSKRETYKKPQKVQQKVQPKQPQQKQPQQKQQPKKQQQGYQIQVQKEKPQKISHQQNQYGRQKPTSQQQIESENQIQELDEEDLESNTDSHVCSYLQELENDINFDMTSMGESSSVCTEFGHIYGQVKAEYDSYLRGEDGFDWPDGFDPQEILQQKWEQEVLQRKEHGHIRHPHQVYTEQSQIPSTGRSHYSQISSKKDSVQYSPRFQEFSKSPGKDADIDTQIRYQQQKVLNMQHQIQNKQQQYPQQKKSSIKKSSTTNTNTTGIKSLKKPSIKQQPQAQSQKQTKTTSKTKQQQGKIVYGKSMNQAKHQKKKEQELKKDSDYESPQKYEVSPSKTPFLGREAEASAQELAIRNNILYKQKKQEEEQKKQIEKEQQELKKQNLKHYNQLVKNSNQSKVQKQKIKQSGEGFKGHKYAWGADQKFLTRDKTIEKEKIKSQKPESVTKYNELHKFFGENQNSHWLEKLQYKVKKEIHDIKKPKAQQRRRSLEIVRLQNEGKNIEQIQPKPFKYLRSKSTMQRDNARPDESEQAQNQKVQERHQQALDELILKEKREKKQKQKKINRKLKNLDEKAKIILYNTKMEKFVPPEEENEREKQQELSLSKQFGDRSMTRFNLEGQYVPIVEQDQEYLEDTYKHPPKKQLKDQNYKQYLEQSSQKQLKKQQLQPQQPKQQQNYGNYNKNKYLQEEEYEQEFYNEQQSDTGSNYQQVFGKETEVVSKKKQGQRLVIGFSNKTEEQEIKNKQGEVLVGWSKKKIEKEQKQNQVIKAQENLRKLQEEREQMKLKKQEELRQKMQFKDDYDDYGYHKQTGDYDEFFDKYKNQNYISQDINNNNNQQQQQSDNKQQDNFDVDDIELQQKIQQQQKEIEIIQEDLKDSFEYKKEEKLYDLQRDGYQFKPQQAEFDEVMDQNQYKRFLNQQKYEQEKIKQITHEKQIKLKDDNKLTEKEQQVIKQNYTNLQKNKGDPTSDLKFMDKKGKQLSQQESKLLMKQADMQDIGKNVKGQQYRPNEYQQDYFQSVEQEIKESMYNNKKSRSRSKNNQRDTEPPIELRKQAALKKAQMEVDRLREPNLDQILRDYKDLDQLGQDYEQKAEKWGELDGATIRGTKPYWEDVRNHARANLMDEDSDDDIYIRSQRIKKSKKGEVEDLEVLDRINQFNEKRAYNNVQKGKHKRIPIDDTDITVYSERCKNEKDRRKEKEQISKNFSKHLYQDSDDDEMGGFRPSYNTNFFNNKQDQVFSMKTEDLLRLDKFEI